MKATFALLPDLQTQNAATEIAWNLFQCRGTGLDVRRLPPHVSLKQPFDVPDLPVVLEVMDELASSLSQIRIDFSGLAVWPQPSAGDPQSGVLLLRLEEVSELKVLHSRLNDMLSSRLGNCPAEFDGDEYEFHLTLAKDGPSFDVYQAIAHELTEFPKAAILESLALFVYDKSPGTVEWIYTTYRVRQLARVTD